MTRDARGGRIRLPYFILVPLYLVVAASWASVCGYHRWELENRTTPHDHNESFLEVTSAGLTSDGDLVLCLYGRRNTCSHVKSEPSAFSLSIPVDSLWRDREDVRRLGFTWPRWGDRWLFVPRDRLGPACGAGSESTKPIAVVRLPETEPSEYFDGFRHEKLQHLRPPEGERRAVFQIPMSADGDVFHEKRQVIYVSAVPDASGFHYYEIHTIPFVDADEVSVSAGGMAFARDALEFPYQLLMLASGGH